jgi:hypothetical protein
MRTHTYICIYIYIHAYIQTYTHKKKYIRTSIGKWLSDVVGMLIKEHTRFWDITLCSVINSACKATLNNIPEDLDFHRHGCENLQFH